MAISILENAITAAKDANARVIGEILREVCAQSAQAAELIEQDLTVPELSLDRCAAALKEYARKHQQGGAWSCGGFSIDPENPAIKVILDFYKIPSDWVRSGAGGPAKPASGAPIDLFDLL